MRKIVLLAIAVALGAGSGFSQLTLERCFDLARDNYPMIKKYDIVKQTENIELSDINKAWLPRLGVYAQGTVQNVVPSFPSSLSDMIQHAGAKMRGLGKLQYKAGIDVNQTIWDGGASKTRRDIARQTAAVNMSALDVDMYAIRQRVQSLYFGILLMDSQIKQIDSSIEVYKSNLERLRAMKSNGTAMQSDVDMVEAQMITLRQQAEQAQSAMSGYHKMLEIFIGEDFEISSLVKPDAALPGQRECLRPELKLFDAQERLNDARQSQIDSSVMPKIGLFAQTYYGYPGIDYFKAMMERNLTFNILAGVKVSWNIDSFYTKKNSRRKLRLSDDEIAVQRETFMFNTDMQSAMQLEEVKGFEKIVGDDGRIVELRKNVRLAAESQLKNGIIDATTLTIKINDETQARLAASYHEIQYLQSIYNYKNTLNR